MGRGQAQIEVTFEVDENSILKVSAVEKATGKTEKIVITNDSGRLSKEEIEKMIKDAEEFAESDKNVKEKIDSKNALENYIYSMKNTVEDKEKLADKLAEGEKEDFETHLKDLQKICDPIIAKIYKQTGGQPGAKEEESTEEPDL